MEQQTNLYSITIAPIVKALEALSKILDKAAAYAESKKTVKRTFEEALLNDRLIFDQFPLAAQVRIACDNAKGGAARLAEVEIPSFEDNEKTIAELQARIAKTLAFVRSVKPEQVVGKEGIKVSLPYWDGKSLSGFEYATEYLMPNFYFHVVTAYAILRKNGVPIGKNDYIGALPLK
ncbi:MAG: DUF1993 domain-containing protein [Patescibacteria group bacterium]